MGQTQRSHYKVSCDAIAATRRENIVPGWVTWPSALASIKTTPFTTSHFLPCLFFKMLTVQETALWSCDPAGSTSHVTHIRPGTGGGSWWGHLNLWAGESSFTQWKTESSTSEVIKCWLKMLIKKTWILRINFSQVKTINSDCPSHKQFTGKIIHIFRYCLHRLQVYQLLLTN